MTAFYGFRVILWSYHETTYYLLNNFLRKIQKYKNTKIQKYKNIQNFNFSFFFSNDNKWIIVIFFNIKPRLVSGCNLLF